MARWLAQVYNWWDLFVRGAEPTPPREAITSRPLLRWSVGRIVQPANRTVLRLTRTRGEAARAQQLLTGLSTFLSGLTNGAGPGMLAWMSPGLETMGVCGLALLGAWLGWRSSRLPKPFWLIGYFIPLTLIIIIGLARRYSILELTPPISWIMSGRIEEMAVLRHCDAANPKRA